LEDNVKGKEHKDEQCLEEFRQQWSPVAVDVETGAIHMHSPGDSSQHPSQRPLYMKVNTVGRSNRARRTNAFW
jgi:hypothetical protein